MPLTLHVQLIVVATLTLIEDFLRKKKSKFIQKLGCLIFFTLATIPDDGLILRLYLPFVWGNSIRN